MLSKRKCLEDAAYETEGEYGEHLDAADDAKNIVELVAHPVGLERLAIDNHAGTAPELHTEVELTADAATGHCTAEAQSQIWTEA